MSMAQLICLIFSYLVCLFLGCYIGCSDSDRTPHYWTTIAVIGALMILFLIGAYHH